MRVRWLFLLPALLLPCISSAQELTALAGATESADASRSSYGWQIDVRHNFEDPFAVSASWINEGHLADHRRDGFAAQVWGRISLVERRLSIAFGAGAYHYFDTRALPGGDHANVHGWSPVYSLAATWYTRTPWFVRLGVNHVNPPGNVDSNQFLLGGGYRLWKEPGDAAASRPATGVTTSRTTDRELLPFLGATVHNSLENRHGVAGGIEFRKGISRHLDWTLSWISEDNGEEIRRHGFGSQIWLVDAYFRSRFTLGFGAGLFTFVDGSPPPGQGGDEQFDITGLVSLTTSYRFAERWFARILWNRVAAGQSRDSDQFLVGAGYRWAE